MIIPVIIAAYLIGSIPFGLLVTRLAGLGDIRSVGSGNIGATNVMRTGYKKLGALTFLLDAGKGIAAVCLAHELLAEPMWVYAAGMVAVLGHIFPVWLKFKGGKGVATALGVMIALDPLVAAVFCVFWLLGFFITRYVSIASLEAVWFAGLLLPLAEGNVPGMIFYALLAALITWTHRANIKRLLDGTENRFTKGSK